MTEEYSDSAFITVCVMEMVGQLLKNNGNITFTAGFQILGSGGGAFRILREIGWLPSIIHISYDHSLQHDAVSSP